MDRGNSAASRDIAFQLHPYTNLKKHESDGPLVLTEGKGVYVTDDTGKKYIEGLAGLWCVSLGYGEERLIEAATKQMRTLAYSHIFNHKSHNPSIDLAERLLRLLPVKMSKVFFNNSGSEANDTAVKLVWYYNNARGKHRKKKIIARMRGYHGVTVAAASLTGLANNHRDFDLPIANVRHADCPHHYRFGKPGESEEQFATRLAESLEAQIIREDPETVAAFIAEPVMGAGGVIPPPKTYFDKIQPILKKYDVLFIADEVICGFGRTGNLFASETFNLKPDILTCAKALSSAYVPISATIISEAIYQACVTESEKIGLFAHGYTYSGHPVASAVANETLKIYEERDIVGHVRKMIPGFQEKFRALGDNPLVGEVRVAGLMGAVELVTDKATKQSFDMAQGVGNMVQMRAQEHGLICRAMGDNVALCPPLIISESEIGDMFQRFGRALDDVAKALGRHSRASAA